MRMMVRTTFNLPRARPVARLEYKSLNACPHRIVVPRQLAPARYALLGYWRQAERHCMRVEAATFSSTVGPSARVDY